MCTIVVVGTADTKADELLYLKQVIENAGATANVMDVGVLGESPFEVAYSKHEVAAAANTTNEAICQLGDENLAMAKTAEGASALCLELYAQGKLDGILLLGGTMGTDLALDVTQALPMGVPKCIVSTVAFSHLIPPERLAPDVMMVLWAGGLYGLNSVCKAVLSQAAGAVLGAAKAVEKPQQQRPLVAMSSLGSSALKYMIRLKEELEHRGYELAVFHTTGLGGQALESLATKGAFACVMDFSLAEVANECFGSVVTSGKTRLEMAGQAGIPQIVAPGGLGLIDVPTWQELAPDYRERPYHAHNRLIASVTATPEEMYLLAKVIAEKLAKAIGPTSFIMTEKGFLEWDREGEDLYAPEALEAFREGIEEHVKTPVDLRMLDAHINDEAFVDAVLEVFDAWVARGEVANTPKKMAEASCTINSSHT